MKFSSRELVLAWTTAVIVLGGVTVWMINPRIQEWKEGSRVRSALADRRRSAERLLKKKDDVNKDLDVFRKQLPQYPAGQNVTSELLKMLESKAQENGLTLLRREPDEEKSVGDLFEVSIKCSYETELEGLVHFLYALQIQGAILDVHELSVQPMQGSGSRLKGNVTIDFAYTRTGSGLGSVQVETNSAP
jgi:hypothetical protein